MKDYAEITDEDGKSLVKKARSVVTEFLKTGKKLELDRKFKDDYSFNAGIFVTLNNPNGLRGCIGHPLSDRRLSDALEDVAIAAATDDPRFPPVDAKELDSIKFEVTILTPPKKIEVSDPNEYPSKIKVGRDGLIVRSGFYSGLLLPQVPVEYKWNEKEFLEFTCQKAGLPKDCWLKPDTEIQKFEGIVFSEKEPDGEVIREEL